MLGLLYRGPMVVSLVGNAVGCNSVVVSVTLVVSMTLVVSNRMNPPFIPPQVYPRLVPNKIYL